MASHDMVSWNAIHGGCGMHGQGKEALKFFEQMCEEGVQPDDIILLSSSSFFLTFPFCFWFQTKTQKKKHKEKGIGIPSMMCITNDDAISNGSKHNNVMKKKKKMHEEGKGKAMGEVGKN
jgi:pentatricopeptide repeat protein